MTEIAESGLTEEICAAWIDRWDAQQTRYIADREDRFAVIGDVIAHTLRDRTTPVVLDVGCGPGSLAVRLADRIPHASLLGVDKDPLLLALAQARYGRRVRFIDADVTVAGWTQALRPVTELDAAVSTTALHWIRPERLAHLYTELAALLRPGGVLVNGDHLVLPDPVLHELSRVAEQGRACRAGVSDNEAWDAWWNAATSDPALTRLCDERIARGLRHGYGNKLSVTDHRELLRAAGFTTIGPVWQYGTDHVLVAVRASGEDVGCPHERIGA